MTLNLLKRTAPAPREPTVFQSETSYQRHARHITLSSYTINHDSPILGMTMPFQCSSQGHHHMESALCVNDHKSTILDAFSRYIVAWKLCTGMTATHVRDTPNLALEETGLDQANVAHRPGLLSDNRPCYISGQLAEYMADKGSMQINQEIKKTF